MGVLQRFERRLGGLVEGAFARVFKGGVEPVELAGALTRECDERQARGARRTLVPNDFTIHLSEPDFERLAPYRQALGDELATLVREHAAAQRYTFVGAGRRPPGARRRLSVGRYTIEQRCRCEAPRAERLPRRPSHQRATAGRRPSCRRSAAPAARRCAVAAAGASCASRPDQPDQTPASRSSPRLIVTVGGSAEQRQPRRSRARATSRAARARSTVIGRGSDVDVQLPDTGVSRRHGELLLQPSGTTSTAIWARPTAAGSTAARCTQATAAGRRPHRGRPQRAGLPPSRSRRAPRRGARAASSPATPPRPSP